MTHMQHMVPSHMVKQKLYSYTRAHATTTQLPKKVAKYPKKFTTTLLLGNNFRATPQTWYAQILYIILGKSTLPLAFFAGIASFFAGNDLLCLAYK